MSHLQFENRINLKIPYSEEKIFKNSSQSETRISHVSHVCFPIWTNEESLYRTFHSCFYKISINLAKWFFILANHKQGPSMVTIVDVLTVRIIEYLYRISHTSFLQSNNSLCILVSKISAIQVRELPMATMFFVQSR